VFAVALALPLFNVMAAFALGVGATVVMLLAKLSGTPVRRIVDGSVRTSLKVRGPEPRAALARLARHIRILELEGHIFFGTAEGLRAQVHALPEDTRYAILDFRRVLQIDTSGARVLQLIGEQAARRGMKLLLSHIRADEPRGRYLRALGMDAAVPPEHWFRDLDRALEWAEDRLLETVRFQDAPELALGQMALLSGLDAAELDLVSGALERREFAHGEVIFEEGDEGDGLFLIARGFVSVKVKLDDDARALRLATFSPGVFFGEIAMIEGYRRSSDAFAKGDRVILYSLSARRFAELVQRHPGVALKIYQNLGRELAARLRATSRALRVLE
jgi:SulP family sulfate permease